MPEIRVGTVLYGFCGGHFGDSYENKRVEAIGADWVVARDENGEVHFATTDTRSGGWKVPECLEEYTDPKNDPYYEEEKDRHSFG